MDDLLEGQSCHTGESPKVNDVSHPDPPPLQPDQVGEEPVVQVAHPCPPDIPRDIWNRLHEHEFVTLHV